MMYVFQDHPPQHFYLHLFRQCSYCRVYALRSLLNALAPLIGAEVELGTAVSPGWAEGASKEQIGQWHQKGLEHTKEEMEILIQETSGVEYGRIMHRVRTLHFRFRSREESLTSKI